MESRVKFRDGDIFYSKSQTLINPVNCFGVMGRGIALKFKNKYPDMFQDYVFKCHSGGIQIGQPYLYKSGSVWILNFPTKYHWRDDSKLSYISDGLLYLKNHYKDWGITSIATPALGCGLGGLDWNEVSFLMKCEFEKFDIPVEIYNPVIGYPPKK